MFVFSNKVGLSGVQGVGPRSVDPLVRSWVPGVGVSMRSPGFWVWVSLSGPELMFDDIHAVVWAEAHAEGAIAVRSSVPPNDAPEA